MRKYYNISEAEELIPALRQRIVNLMKLNSAIDLLDSIDIQYDNEYETIKRDVLMNKKFHEFSVKFCKEVEDLLEKGIVVRDLHDGLVDFFSLHEGKEIFLCWKAGEDNIGSWYSVGANYDSKKPIDELKGKKKV